MWTLEGVLVDPGLFGDYERGIRYGPVGGASQRKNLVKGDHGGWAGRGKDSLFGFLSSCGFDSDPHPVDRLSHVWGSFGHLCTVPG